MDAKASFIVPNSPAFVVPCRITIAPGGGDVLELVPAAKASLICRTKTRQAKKVQKSITSGGFVILKRTG